MSKLIVGERYYLPVPKKLKNLYTKGVMFEVSCFSLNKEYIFIEPIGEPSKRQRLSVESLESMNPVPLKLYRSELYQACTKYVSTQEEELPCIHSKGEALSQKVLPEKFHRKKLYRINLL